LKVKFIRSNALDLVKREWEELSLKQGESVTEYHKLFRHLGSKSEPHQPMAAEMLADTYGYKIKKVNQGVYKDSVRYIGICDRTPTFEQRMENVAALDMTLNKSQPGGIFKPNTTTTMTA
jgi:hypothetical protein